MHHLVAAFLGHKPPPPADEPHADADAAPAGADVWMHAGMGAIAGPAEARTAPTTAAAVAAYERMFFGEVIDGKQL